MESQVNPALIGKNVEFRVREIKRYIVTKYERDVQDRPTGADAARSSYSAAASSVHGEYENFDTAYAVAYALAKTEHDRLGYPIDDMRIQYPVHASPGTELVMDPAHHSAEEIRLAGRCFVNSEGEIESSS